VHEILEGPYGSALYYFPSFCYPGVVTLSFMSIHSEGLCHLSFFLSVRIMLQVFAWCFLYLHPGRFFVTFQFVWG